MDVPTAADRPQRSWRIPPVQPAALFLLTSITAAVNLYAHPSAEVRYFTILLGLVSFCVAVSWLRMFLVVDQDGIALRNVLREVQVPWSDIERVDVVSGVRGSSTIRFYRLGGGMVDVPPSLLQPTKPTSKPRARELLNGIRQEIEQLSRQPRKT
jgi:hypothetical protein